MSHYNKHWEVILASIVMNLSFQIISGNVNSSKFTATCLCTPICLGLIICNFNKLFETKKLNGAMKVMYCAICLTPAMNLRDIILNCLSKFDKKNLSKM